MLQLTNITKDYQAGTTIVKALKGIDLEFRENEFVSILGPSGCGKTTLLNLLGGLDRYNSGDLIINGKSTKDFTDRDWDTYRNRRIGFVFQNYNLIPHQTVLSNVELALTLSGISKVERRKRAVEVLDKVGLSDQMDKKPNQMSGGQMQRVAIARSLINNPDILLADEPTGALDSETSIQIMKLIQEIAEERLVIMVTHNGELAEEYSTRIIKLFDGNLVDDSNPMTEDERKAGLAKNEEDGKGKEKNKRQDKTSMSFFTALSLSFNNLLTKKARTFMTAFAGSIGIIGIALILALSSGLQGYIDKVQEDMLSTYPIIIEDITSDIGAIMDSMQGVHDSAKDNDLELDKVYSNDIMFNLLSTVIDGQEENDLKAFKKHLDNSKGELDPLVNAITYGYNIDINIYETDYSNGVKKVNPTDVLNSLAPPGADGPMMMPMASQSMDVWAEMIDNEEFLNSQYDVLAGRWPKSKDEVVLFVDENNKLTDYALYSLGLKDSKEIDDMMEEIMKGNLDNKYETESLIFTYDELLDLKYKMLLSTDVYEKSDDSWKDMSENDQYMKELLDDALDIKIVGIMRPSEDSGMVAMSASIGYTKELTEYIIDKVDSAEIVQEQLANEDVDVFTGKEFVDPDAEPEEVDMSSLSEEELAYLMTLTEVEQQELLANFAPQSTGTYEGNINKLGMVDVDIPSTISIYPKSLAEKEVIETFIADYNEENSDDENENVIHYTDFAGLMMSSISTIINMITYILIGFVGISLVVSSIMIGIITYVSVLERTKEIGILKSIGASKKDISRVFNAETLIVGFVAGMLGVMITVLLTIPANIIIKHLSGVSNIAVLPYVGAAVLVILSMSLTLIAGLIPSRVAAKKDPVVALRTE